MKRISSLLLVLCCTLWMNIGCGKKGDPSIPVVPQPLPIQDLSVSVDTDGITLSWLPPTVYTNQKQLDPDDIKTFTILRKTEAPSTNNWDFSQSSRGWTAVGRTLPVKLHKGALRTASEQKFLFIRSQEDLSISAERYRYLQLKLWAQNSQQGYIAFTTTNDNTWDSDVDLTFQPTVHTSYFTFQQVFNTLKLKPFSILSTPPNVVQEYRIDMSTLPSWKGDIKQIGLILVNSEAEQAVIELGLDNLALVDDREQNASLYDGAPWIFREDEEGWTASASGGFFGAVADVLYIQGAETIALQSAAGQEIPLDDPLRIRIRMKVTAGEVAYLLLRRHQDKPFSKFTSISASSSPDVIQIPLEHQTEFQTYTITVDKLFAATPEIVSKDEPLAATPKIPEDERLATTPESGQLSDEEKSFLTQVGLVFPALTAPQDRHILIDYIDIIPSDAKSDERVAMLTQLNIPSIADVEQQIRQTMDRDDPEFDVPYDELPSEEEHLTKTSITLVEISPNDPAPAVIKDGRFSLTDSGDFLVDDDKQATLDYGTRYTYQIKLTDRKKRVSELSAPVTVEFAKAPLPPGNLKAKAGDSVITLVWDRPFLTTDGEKIRSLVDYKIFRSLESGSYPEAALSRVASRNTLFSDTSVSNGVQYYYVIQPIASRETTISPQEFSEQVSATPFDDIPPDPPIEVVGVYLRNGVNLYWNQVQVKDFAGFNVYRSENPEGPFQKLNTQPIPKASYTDSTTETKKRYYYRATSFDTAIPPNESQPSEMTFVDTFPLD